MANRITCIRIICSIVLLFCEALSTLFCVVYIIAGITDMVDGTVARKTGTSSEFGAKLDTIADLALVVACLIKLLPVLNMENWMYVWIAVIAAIKMVNIISGFVCEKRVVTAHTIANKIAGVLLFILPLSLGVIELKYSAAIVCAVATFAAVQEGHYIRTGRIERHD